MSIQFQSLEGRALFSATLPVSIASLTDFSSLTSALTDKHHVLSSDQLSQMKSDLSAINADGTLPSAKSVKNFKVAINNAFADGEISAGDRASINVATGSLLKSEGLSVSETKAIDNDFATVLKSKLPVAQKQAFFQKFTSMQSLFSKLGL